MKVVVFTKEKDDFYREVIAYLETVGVRVAASWGSYKAKDGCFSVVLGGDGTVLAATRKGIKNPILVINTGHLGFLTSAQKIEYDWKQAIDRIVSGNFTTQVRNMLDISVGGNKYTALNEVVIAKDGLSKLVKVGLYITHGRSKEELVSEYRADGLIISTPTGSTAYNLSAGGPIIHPSCESFVVTPICPQGLTQRPLVLPAHLKIRVRPLDMDNSHDLYLSVDGQVGQPLNASVAIQQHTHKIEIVQPNSSYFQVLRHKLGWGIKPV